MDPEQEKAELEKLKAEIAAADAEYEQVQAAREPTAIEKQREALAAAKQRTEDARNIAELEKRHGKLGKRIQSMSTPGGMLVIKAPDRMAYRQMVEAGRGGKGTPPFDAQELFVKSCLVYPLEREKQSQILHDFPGAVSALADAAIELGGFAQVTLQGK